MRYKENDWYYVKTEAIQNAAQQKDLVILQNAWIVKDFLHYFTDLRVQSVPLKDSSQTTIDSLFNYTILQKGKVFILPEINNKMSAPDTRYLDSIRTQYANRLRLYRPKEPEIWVIE